MQSYFQPHKTDLSGVSRVVCIQQEVGKGDTSQESWTGCTAYLCWSRRSKCYCLPRHQKSSHSPHCFEWEETRVGFRVCHWGALQSVGSCHSPVFRKSKASLSITSSPTAPARKNGAKMFCTSCCLNQIQIPCIWNGSWAIFLRAFSEGLPKRMFWNGSCSLD